MVNPFNGTIRLASAMAPLHPLSLPPEPARVQTGCFICRDKHVQISGHEWRIVEMKCYSFSTARHGSIALIYCQRFPRCCCGVHGQSQMDELAALRPRWFV